MKKYKLIIKQLFPLSEKAQAKILAKFEFFSESVEDAENFKNELSKLFAISGAVKTSPRNEYLIVSEEEIKE